VKTFFAVIGLFTFLFAILGACGIGEFRLYYGDDPRGCTKIEAKLSKALP
jgi:hypothetical protein